MNKPMDWDLSDGDGLMTLVYLNGEWRRPAQALAIKNLRAVHPSAPGRYFWTEWNKWVDVGMAVPADWKPRKGKRPSSMHLCVLPFPGFRKPIRISSRMAGEFYGSV